MILPLQALHQHRRCCSLAVSHDLALLGANFTRIETDSHRVYSGALYKKALEAHIHGPELTVMPIEHREFAFNLTQSKKPAPGRFDRSGHLGGIRLIQSVLPNQKQQVHRHRSELAQQVVGVKPTRKQTLLIYVALELRINLLMGCVIPKKRNDLSRAQARRQRRRTTFEHVLRQQQGVAALVDGLLDQKVDAPARVGITAYTRQLQAFLPDALAFTQPLHYPLCGAIGHLTCSNHLHWCSARVQLDDESNLAFELEGLGREFLHQIRRTKARVDPHQRRHSDQTGSHGQSPLKVVLALGSRMLHIGGQDQLQAIKKPAQLHSKRAVAAHSGISAPNQIFLGTFVDHGKGTQINQGV